MDPTLPSLFSQLDEYRQALGEVHARAAAGLTAVQSAGDVAKDFPAFVRPESFAAVQEQYASPSLEPRKKERLALLWPFLGEQLVDFHARAADEAAEAFERIAHVGLSDEELGLPQALQRLRTERERERRVNIDRQLSGLLFDHQSPYARRIEAAIDLARSLGFASYRSLVETTTGAPLQPLQDACAAALKRSEDAYRDLLGHFLKKVDARLRPLPSGSAQRHDLQRLGALDAPFAKADLWPVAQRWLEELGFSPDAQGRIQVSVGAGLAGGVAVAVQIPSSVRLFIHPGVGLWAWASALAAVGSAQHLAGTGEDLPPERRWLGDPAHLQASGMLFAHALHDEGWLRRYLGLTHAESREVARLTAFCRLYKLREACAAVAYELELYDRGPSEGLADQFVARGRGALFVDVPKGFFLRDVAPHLRAAAQVRALAQEIALRRRLEERFNEDHWRNPGAQSHLAQRFSGGQVARVEELDVAAAADRLVAVMSR